MTGKLIGEKALRAAVHLNSARMPSQVIKSSTALFSAFGGGKPASLPDLPYDYNALERMYKNARFLH